jgi:hypothetical protein
MSTVSGPYHCRQPVAVPSHGKPGLVLQGYHYASPPVDNTPTAAAPDRMFHITAGAEGLQLAALADHTEAVVKWQSNGILRRNLHLPAPVKKANLPGLVDIAPPSLLYVISNTFGEKRLLNPLTPGIYQPELVFYRAPFNKQCPARQRPGVAGLQWTRRYLVRTRHRAAGPEIRTAPRQSAAPKDGPAGRR